MANTNEPILSRILRRKVEEIAERAQAVSLERLSRRVDDCPPTWGFVAALDRARAAGRPGVIAEIKRASPSAGELRAEFDPTAIAQSYRRAGVTCLSVLTDRDFFQGDDTHLQAAREAAGLPVLRKDFVVDPYQIYEARVLGADAILLIVSALGEPLLRELYQLAMELELDVLIEVHNQDELERALELAPALVGINNRDLRRFTTDLQTSLDLLERITEPETTVISESGIHTREDVARLRAAGVHGFLVGEAFMRADDPGTAARNLFPELVPTA
jgi:indole-3-glycerol phosphate synthase